MLENAMLSFSLMGTAWILWILILLSIMCLAVTFERWFFLRKHQSNQAAILPGVSEFLKTGNMVALREHLEQGDGFEARILLAGLSVSERGPTAMEQAMSAIASRERLSLERRLSLLATVGANAPFIGLLGTVLGIIQAFHDLAINTAEASEAVMGGISEALVATAMGLLVAIPAVVLYNILSRWVKRLMKRAEATSQLVVAHIHQG